MESLEYLLAQPPKDEHEIIHHLAASLVKGQMTKDERVIIDTYYVRYWNFWFSHKHSVYLALLSSFFDERTRSIEICPASAYGLTNRKFRLADPPTEASKFIRHIADTIIRYNENSRLR